MSQPYSELVKAGVRLYTSESRRGAGCCVHSPAHAPPPGLGRRAPALAQRREELVSQQHEGALPSARRSPGAPLSSSSPWVTPELSAMLLRAPRGGPRGGAARAQRGASAASPEQPRGRAGEPAPRLRLQRSPRRTRSRSHCCRSRSPARRGACPRRACMADKKSLRKDRFLTGNAASLTVSELGFV